ncbi:MOSC domain-containing protein [Wansuia hejianensis]|uniref:MOSC domain-containing protein n=1 Tax=Wansuia hejianensis TaxID=2763667 RepID=A0A926F2V7_9FIRM|nr:hypothetical protein [Wansuia hejianensis]MBC8590977.1 hypothetical protein [Wansuia hejianensis]
MKVAALKVRDSKDNICYISEAFLEEDRGIVGDLSKRQEYGQVSILGSEFREIIDDEKMEGLCSFGFDENITIEDLDTKDINIGQRLVIGDTVHEIICIGRRCAKDCKLIQLEGKCKLFMNVVFTKIIKGGVVKVDDKVISLR